MSPALSLTTACAVVAAVVGAAAGAGVGCLSTNYQWVAQLAPDAAQPVSAADVAACEQQCASTSGCTAFTFGPTANSCWLGQPTGGLSELAGAVSGKLNCDEEAPPACGASVNSSWPASTAEDSAALWSTGYQPTPLQCYPLDSLGEPQLCPGTEPTVLQDVASGWLGYCHFLENKTLLAGETCQSKCLATPSCPSWQIGYDGTCWQGVGYKCNEDFSWNSSFHPTQAQRIQHGSVRVLAQMSGVQLPSLQNVFGFNATMVDPAGDCRKVCYSVLSCTYWQLSSQTGCWAQVPNAHNERVPYPLTLTVLNIGPEPGSNFIAGEFIQHYCPEPEAAEEEEDAGLDWWVYVLIAFCILLFILLCTFVCYQLGKYCMARKPAKKTRTLQVEEAKPLTFLPPVYAQPAGGSFAGANATFVDPTAASFMMAPQGQSFIAPQYLPQAGYGLAPGGVANAEQGYVQQGLAAPMGYNMYGQAPQQGAGMQYNYSQLPQQPPGGAPQAGYGYGGGGGGGGAYPY